MFNCVKERRQRILESYLNPSHIKGFSTIDHVFTFKCIVDVLSKCKRLYSAFIDDQKAFDSIDRLMMWKHILKNQFGGKFFKAVYNMYKNAKACIKNCSNLGYFPCSSGVHKVKIFHDFYLLCTDVIRSLFKI